MIARRLITALLLAILISGGFTFWLSKRFSARSSPPSHRYVTSAQNIEAGGILRPVDVTLVEWPATSPLEGAFLKPEDVLGRTLLYPLSKGEPILERQLYTGTGVGMSIKIPEGMRAVSLKSDQVVGVAGFLLPGTHIDVLVTYHTSTSADPITGTVLQDAQILAAGQKMQPDPEGKASTVDVVTLLVTPADAEKVVLASAQGSVHFVLRNSGDHQHRIDAPAEMSALGGMPAPLPVKQARPSVPRDRRLQPVMPVSYSVRVSRGDKQTVETFK
jgi:pilus assembly protein CpaB